VRDVWVYAASRERAGAVRAGLSELGFGARYLGPGHALVPAPADGAPLGRPMLAVVVLGPDEAPGHVLVDRLHGNEELSDVGLLLVTPPEQLRTYARLAAADELIVEPFTIGELEARVARATRQAASTESPATISAGSLELNPATHEAAVDGDPVGFTYMEYELLRFLMSHPNRVFSREALLHRVWGYDYFGGARTVDVHIRRVRAKLGEGHADRIKTVRSVGYLFELPTARRAPARLRSVV
jgi:DNA-binding response OmpR family regulator